MLMSPNQEMQPTHPGSGRMLWMPLWVRNHGITNNHLLTDFYVNKNLFMLLKSEGRPTMAPRTITLDAPQNLSKTPKPMDQTKVRKAGEWKEKLTAQKTNADKLSSMLEEKV